MLQNTDVVVWIKCFHLILLLACASNDVVRGHTIDDVERVLSDKFDPTKYNKLIRGQRDLSVPMNITVDLALKSIVQVDEIQESVQVLALMFVDWKDDRLVWNSTEYNGTHEVFMPVENVWHPEMFVELITSEPIMIGDVARQLTMHNNLGMARWTIVEMFKFSCSFDLTSFPWDVQTCEIVFTVWGYLKQHINLSSNIDSIILDYYEESSSWEIIPGRVHKADIQTKSRVAYQFVLRRRPEFFVMTIFLPIVFLSVMSLLVYSVPIESGERISFSLTTLLSIVLFITLLSANLPQSAETIPAMCFFLLFELIQCIMVCLCNIISINYYYKDIKNGKPGIFWQRLLFYYRRNGCMKCLKVKQDNNDDEVIQINNKNEGDIVQVTTEKSQVNQMDVDWKDISRMLDNIFLIGMILFSVFCYSLFAYHLIARQ